jgi:excinuclease ABC subunit B
VRVIAELEREMLDASAKLEFERAAHLRDQIAALKEGTPAASAPRQKVSYPKGRGRKK